jgi:protein-S-isoprenylcysteine O-methyltransferase Ste14
MAPGGDFVIDAIRHFLGVATVLVVPAGLVYWLVIHTFARWWRRLGPGRTYVVVLSVVAVTGALLFRIRRQLMGEDLGTNWIFIAIALILSVPMMWLEGQYLRRLKLSTLMGIPELSANATGRLIREGIYGVVRHPRYLSAGIGLIVNALIINHAGVYLLVLAALVPGYLMVLLEERELIGRFGDAYRDYQRQVPRFFPHLGKNQLH